MDKTKDENKVILKQWVRVFLILIVLGVMGFSIFTIAKTLKPEQLAKKKLYSYNYTTNLDYKVYLKNNEFFKMAFMGMNKQYITSIIDHIEVDAKYNFQSTEDLDYSYNYEIVATAKALGEDADGKTVDVWSRSYPLSSLQSDSGEGKNFSINKTVNVDYNTYNQVLSNFRNQFGLSVDSRVDLELKVNVTAGLKGAEKTLSESKTMTLKMPLLAQTMRITPDYVNSGGDTIYSNETPGEAKVNVPVIIVSAVVSLISLVILVKLVRSLLVVTKKSEYLLAVNKIMKEYADIIAETHNMPDLRKYDVVNVKTFTDMVDIEEELHSPIIYFEIEENTKCVFLILHDKTAYRFLLRESDFDHLKIDRDDEE